MLKYELKNAVLLFFIVIVAFLKDQKYSQNSPELIVEYNGKEFKTKVNEGLCFESNGHIL